MLELGNRTEDSVLDFKWNTNDSAGASVTRATNGTVSVYKGNNVTQTTLGVTDTEDFDSLTGVHHCRIDTSADAFYAVAEDYQVVLSAATIDGQTVNHTLAAFRIEKGFQEVDVVKWLGTAVATPSVAGVPEVDVTHFNGTAGTFSAGRPEVNTTHVGGTAQTARDIGASVLVGDKTGFKLASDGLALVVPSDPAAIPVLGVASIVTWIGYFGAWTVNEVNSDSNSVDLKNSSGGALASHPTSDNGTTFTSGEPT